ncbi:MAG: hypothetical protein QXO30_02205 [Candidatus Caldarchaeum sp.]
MHTYFGGQHGHQRKGQLNPHYIQAIIMFGLNLMTSHNTDSS